MPLVKLTIKPGVNREKPRYAAEGQWYETDKVRFRQGLPEKIGGWQRTSNNKFVGLCRSLLSWAQLSGEVLRAIGTSKKFYIEQGTAFSDITPLRIPQVTLGASPITTTNASSTVTVEDSNVPGAAIGDYVIIAGVGTVGGLAIDGEWVITDLPTASSFSFKHTSRANSTGTGGLAGTVSYQINVSGDLSSPITGFGAGPYGFGTYGIGTSSSVSLRKWNIANFGEDIVFGPRGEGVYYWSPSMGSSNPGIPLSDLPDASNTPTVADLLLVSDVSRFVFAFGTNIFGSPSYDPMLIRWSDQEDAGQWTPKATNLSGFLRLSRGSRIVAVKQARQEVLVWTDMALYSMQFLGAPAAWGAQIVGENITIMSSDTAAYSNGVAFWMGAGKFYIYDGTVRPLRCDIRRYIFDDINMLQSAQFFAGTNEEFHEVWWFYCSAKSNQIDRYVIYNYSEDIWYYGTMARTTWQDNAIDGKPIAATYSNNIVTHEYGVDDAENPEKVPINAYAQSAEFDIEDGDRFIFSRRVIPEVSFEGSTAPVPCVYLSLLPLRNPGEGYITPASEGLTNIANIERTVTVPIEQYTSQLNIRVRGRQMVVRLESNQLGVQWQVGAVRLDMREDGRG